MEPSPFERVASCPACGASASRPALETRDFHLTREPFALLDCTTCGLRRTDPRPTQTTIGRYYTGEDYFSHNTTNRSALASLYRFARSFTLWGKHRLIRRIKPAGQVLDVGCGTGQLLAHLARRGYRVHGVEPGAAARNQAQALGVEVAADIATVIRHSNDRFDVVMLWHVLEHLPDPTEALKQLRSLLRADGALLIAVPNRSALDCAHYGIHWAAWDVPRHLWHFRLEDVTRMLTDSGFRLRKTRPMWLDAYYIALLSERYRGSKGTEKWMRAFIQATRSNISALLGKTPTSSTLFIAEPD